LIRPCICQLCRFCWIPFLLRLGYFYCFDDVAFSTLRFLRTGHEALLLVNIFAFCAFSLSP
jgi:hypothetical protein